MRTVFYMCKYILNAHLTTNEALLSLWKATQIWNGTLVHLFLSVRPALLRDSFFSSLFPVFPFSSSPVSTCTALRCGAREIKGWNKWVYVPVLECEKVKEERAGRVYIFVWSLVESQNKITCCCNISPLTQHPLPLLLSLFIPLPVTSIFLRAATHVHDHCI